MRIICPNCDAQYEVPDEVIPPEGRDVQCSNCGTTWMHEHSGQTGGEPATQEEAADGDETERGDPPRLDVAEGDGDPDSTDPGPRRKELDPVVAGILREEAQRESDARVRDSVPESLEMQPDLGLTEGEDAASQRDREARERRARLRDTSHHDRPARSGVETAEAAVPATEDTASRKTLLPDVEDINSSLRATDDRAAVDDRGDMDDQGEGRRRRGFGRGFVFAVLVFALAALAYRFAPEIAQAVPQTDPWISAYVTWVDELRVMADEQVRNLLTWLDDLTASGA